jgi:hypothetical protein
MKKEIKTNVKPSSAKATAGKEETDTEMLARIMVNGFEEIMKIIATLATKEKLSIVEKKLSFVEDDITSIRGELSSIKEEQKETNRRLFSIERKQTGIVLSLDETVHRSEFEVVVRRVEALEKR